MNQPHPLTRLQLFRQLPLPMRQTIARRLQTMIAAGGAAEQMAREYTQSLRENRPMARPVRPIRPVRNYVGIHIPNDRPNILQDNNTLRPGWKNDIINRFGKRSRIEI